MDLLSSPFALRFLPVFFLLSSCFHSFSSCFSSLPYLISAGGGRGRGKGALYVCRGVHGRASVFPAEDAETQEKSGSAPGTADVPPLVWRRGKREMPKEEESPRFLFRLSPDPSSEFQHGWVQKTEGDEIFFSPHFCFQFCRTGISRPLLIHVKRTV